jgi:CBS domain containing-hemolysin-like protein
MQPRELIHSVSVDATIADAAREAVRSRHTRLPVLAPSRGLDAPVGLIHAHDLLAARLDDERTDLRAILRPLAHVPAEARVTELLKRMLDERRHMVLVADDHGRTVGLVTLEDLVEELVGEIESDTERPPPSLSAPRLLSAHAR